MFKYFFLGDRIMVSKSLHYDIAKHLIFMTS